MTTLVLGKRRTSRWGLVTVLAALLTALVVYSYLSWLRSQIPVAGRLVPMVVASSDIPQGVRVTAGMVEIVQHPSRFLPDGALSSMEDAVGRLATMPILSGEPVTGRRMARNAGASGAVPPGMRAYGLDSDALSGLALWPSAGDSVDILATSAGPENVARTVTILQSVPVLSVGDRDGSSSGVASTLGVGSGTEDSITLLLSPEEAETLAQAEAVGTITLVLVPTGPLGE